MLIMGEKLAGRNYSAFPKLAIVIPTYNNPDYIKDILEDELPHYKKNNIDLYIMDSSEREETEKLAKDYQDGSNHLHYIRVLTDIHSNRKVYMAYQMAGAEIPCDYMWVRSDATRASRTLLEALPFYLRKGYDFIVTSYEGAYPKGIWETRNPQEIFDEYCWRLCLYGAAILNVKRMLLPADWDYLEKKYLREDRINFSHTTFYFEQMLRIDAFHALIMGVPPVLYHLTDKKKKSSWYRDIFKMWLEIWPNAIEALPNYYKRKLEAIRDFGINVQYYYMPMLRKMAEESILTKEIYAKYEKRIKKYANMPWENFRDAAYGLPSENDTVGQEAYYAPLFREMFRNNYRRRYIYGCGKVAKRRAEILQEHSISFDAFVVSKREEAERKGSFMGYDVTAVDDCAFSDGCGILLAMNRENQKEVVELLRKKGLLKYVYLEHGSYAKVANLVETVQCHALNNEMEDWT